MHYNYRSQALYNYYLIPTLMKRITEHKLKLAVKCGDTNNGIAVRVWEAQHQVDWELGYKSERD